MTATDVLDPTGTARTDELLAELRDMNARLARMERGMERVSHRIEGLEELREDLWPMIQGASHRVSRKLHELDQQGAVGFVRESMAVAERIMTSFDEEDVRLLGDNVVSILQTVRNLTQPEVLELADRAAVALREPEEEPRKVGLLRALRDPEVRRGMTLLLSVLRELGSEPGLGGGKAVQVVAARGG